MSLVRRHIRRVRDVGLRRLVIAFVALAAVIAASVTGYITSRQSTNDETYFGNWDNPNHVEVTVWITRVDSATQALSVTVMNVLPNGSLADDSGNFAQDTTVTTAAIGNWRAEIKAGDPAPDIEQRVGIAGSVTDYPFDRYTGHLEVHALGPDGTELPVALTVLNTDPFFGMTTTTGQIFNTNATGGVGVNLGIHRSMPTLIFAVFVMVLMLGLAIGAVVAAFYVLHWRRGLIFPACSMMAAILFALIPLRNAVPGSPPIGSIIDFGSFFIAEAVISIALISSIVWGFRHQRSMERAESQPEPIEPAEEVPAEQHQA
jgi:FlaG/FlaF family flagellin (archaellin)